MGRRHVTVVAFAALGACGVACGSSGAGGFVGVGTDGGPPLVEGGPLLPDVASLGEGGGDGTAGQFAEVFGESPDTLYKVDPLTKAVTVVGAFQGCSQVTDIALDKDSSMFGTTFDGLYKIDRTTAKCTLVASGASYPNSLSFVPAGTLDANVEALVGYVGDTYVRIDTQTGAMTNVNKIGQGYSSSGDIVSVKGGGTYLTVKGGPNNCNDCLIQVDPTNGAFLLEWGPMNHTNVFGIAFWAGVVYGFDNAGELFEIDFSGLAMQITNIALPNAPAGLQFFGAGSTTSAPPTVTK